MRGAGLRRAGLRAGLIALLLIASSAASAGAQPRLPCEGAARPAHAALGARLAVQVWRPQDLAGPWTPPSCSRWTERAFSALIALAGRFDGVASAEQVLRRMGAVSQTREVVYWSYSRKRWRRLFEETAALQGPDPDLRRDDFSPAELAEGRDYYVWQKENAAVSGSVLRIRLHEIAPDGIVLEQVNVTETRLFLIPLLGAGDYEALLFLTRERDDVWTYYHIIRYGDGEDAFTESHRASLLNRADALFRYLAGLPSGTTEPLAP